MAKNTEATAGFKVRLSRTLFTVQDGQHDSVEMELLSEHLGFYAGVHPR